MSLSRRDITKLALAAALVAPALPLRAKPAPTDWATRLSEALNAQVAPGSDTRFQVHGVQHKGAPLSVMEAHVQLDWAPGTRSRLIKASGPTDPAAFAQLVTACETQFAEALTPKVA